ncbi:MAG TPA: hypothetical protein DC047_13465 [Blastocatellia bacterium]|nr:hypothetical protein [Blastocatellia bacterium]
MPQVQIKASSQATLPAPQQFQTWIQAWSQAPGGSTGVWGQPNISGGVATINVVNLTVQQISDVIQTGISAYNQAHPGVNTITVVVEE